MLVRRTRHLVALLASVGALGAAPADAVEVVRCQMQLDYAWTAGSSRVSYSSTISCPVVPGTMNLHVHVVDERNRQVPGSVDATTSIGQRSIRVSNSGNFVLRAPSVVRVVAVGDVDMLDRNYVVVVEPVVRATPSTFTCTYAITPEDITCVMGSTPMTRP